MPMPSAPAKPLCLPTRPSKEAIQEAQKAKDEAWNNALECGFNKVGLLLFQQLAGKTFTGEVLADELQDSWDKMLMENKNQDSKYIQLHTRVDLTSLVKTDILEGEDVTKPTAYNSTTKQDEPVSLTVGRIMSWKDKNGTFSQAGSRLRYSMNQMLQDMGAGGLCVQIFLAKNKGTQIPWTYDIKIIRDRNSDDPADWHLD